MLVINGWSVLAHPLLLDQLETLTAAVGRARAKDPDRYRSTANVMILASLEALIFKIVPADPASPIYRQGGTLGPDRKHWFRAKFGGQRFRLFFRYSSDAKIIIFAWTNDETTLRTYGSKTDGYAVFKRMLDDGNPPDQWVVLLQEARDGSALKRLGTAYKRQD